MVFECYASAGLEGLCRLPVHRTFLLGSSLKKMEFQKNDTAWMGLYRDFYNLDDGSLLDDRSIAAVAYMGPNGTTEIMRTKMGDVSDPKVLPFWTAGNSIQHVKGKTSSFDRLTQYRKVKVGTGNTGGSSPAPVKSRQLEGVARTEINKISTAEILRVRAQRKGSQ